MSTFGERESKEERYALPKFAEWCKERRWEFVRFRYAEALTELDLDSFSNLSKEERKKIRKAFKEKIDFKHDGIMCRSIGLRDAWFFDLKYKEISEKNPLSYRWVNQDSYEAYYALTHVLPFMSVFCVHDPIHGENHSQDTLYFHRVRGPSKPHMDTDRSWDNKIVYIIPEKEYYKITGFTPWLKSPKTLIEYIIYTKKGIEIYKAWKEGRLITQRDWERESQEFLTQEKPDLWEGIYPPLLNAKKLAKQLKRGIENITAVFKE